MSTATLNTKNKFLSVFENFSSKDSSTYRAQAKNVLEKVEIPTTRMENWKYTRTSFLSKNNFKLALQSENIDITPYIINPEYYHIVFVNGKLAMENTVFPKSVNDILKCNMEEYTNDLETKNFFTVLNSAYYTGGINMCIPLGIQLEIPIHIIHISTENYISNVHHVIKLEKGAEAEVLFSFHTTSENSFLNITTEIECDENAKLTAHLFQLEEFASAQYNYIHCTQAKSSIFSVNTFSLGNAWIRNDLDIDINGSRCEANLNGVYLPQNNQHIDNHTKVSHRQPHSISNELYKGVLTQRSTGVFNGKVFVEKNAQKTNAYQSNANILLSDEATIYSKPELEIYADDVKCSHGSTVGQFDEDALFYLQSRGIGKNAAMHLLVQAFVSDVTKFVTNQDVKCLIESLIANRFKLNNAE